MSMEVKPKKRPQQQQDRGETARKKPKLQSRKKRPGFDEQILSETGYYFSSGLRYVKPYYFTFTSHAKGRWVGSTIFEVFCREFQAESPAFYERAIKAGKVTVNGKVADLGTVIGHNALVCHRVHRHEPPVTAQPINIIHEDDHLVVVCKPASIPVHPCGRYRHNTMVFILAKDHGLKHLHTVHRLDRLTSGLLLFAKSLSRAQSLEAEIHGRTVEKEYLCRVKGEFPSEPVECNEPIIVASHKLGVCRVDSAGKPCSTLFTKLSYNGSSSLLRCSPRTGRMHQIRVHLQWLGYPIINDPLYDNPAWGPGRGKKGEKERDLNDVITEIVQGKFYSSETALSVDEAKKCVGDEGRIEVVSRDVGGDEGGQVKEKSIDDGQASCSAREAHQVSTSPITEPVFPGEAGAVAPLTARNVADKDSTSSLGETAGGEEGTILAATSSEIRTAVGICSGTEKPAETVCKAPVIAVINVVSPAEMVPDSTSEASLVKASTTLLPMDTDKDRLVTMMEGGTERLAREDKGRVMEGGSGEKQETVGGSVGRRTAAMEEPVQQQGTQAVRHSASHAHAPSSPNSGGKSLDPLEVEWEQDTDCTECSLQRPDPTPQQLMIYLHALHYKGNGWDFQTVEPDWAHPDWTEP